MRVNKQTKDINKTELNILKTGNKLRAMNTPYILGLKTAVIVKKEGISKEEF
jgi:hypothetical protein